MNKVNVERQLLLEETPLCSALHRANYKISAWRQGPNGSIRPSPNNLQPGMHVPTEEDSWEPRPVNKVNKQTSTDRKDTGWQP
jgi:hypothetical protein